jgi:hypothetical protein
MTTTYRSSAFESECAGLSGEPFIPLTAPQYLFQILVNFRLDPSDMGFTYLYPLGELAGGFQTMEVLPAAHNVVRGL